MYIKGTNGDFMKHYARLTVDMSLDEHTHVKMASAQLGMTMREFVLLATFEKMKLIDDPWLAEKATETLEQLRVNKDSVLS
jgi:hypothetical protein